MTVETKKPPNRPAQPTPSPGVIIEQCDRWHATNDLLAMEATNEEMIESVRHIIDGRPMPEEEIKTIVLLLHALTGSLPDECRQSRIGAAQRIKRLLDQAGEFPRWPERAEFGPEDVVKELDRETQMRDQVYPKSGQGMRKGGTNWKRRQQMAFAADRLRPYAKAARAARGVQGRLF